MNKWILCALILAACWSASAQLEIKGTPGELSQYLAGVPRTVTIRGEAEVRVPAGRAVVSFRVTTENRSLQEALRANLELRNRLTDQLNGHGIPADRIQASRFSSTPQYGIFGEKPKSYRVENVLRVGVQDETELQRAAGVVDAWAEVQFAGVEFEYADREASKQKTIAQACDNANARKLIYEEKLGLALAPVKFHEEDVAQVEIGPRHYGSSGPKTYSSSVPSFSAPSPLVADGPTSSFGEMVYTARVSVEYLVKPQ